MFYCVTSEVLKKNDWYLSILMVVTESKLKRMTHTKGVIHKLFMGMIFVLEFKGKSFDLILVFHHFYGLTEAFIHKDKKEGESGSPFLIPHEAWKGVGVPLTRIEKKNMRSLAQGSIWSILEKTKRIPFLEKTKGEKHFFNGVQANLVKGFDTKLY